VAVDLEAVPRLWVVRLGGGPFLVRLWAGLLPAWLGITLLLLLLLLMLPLLPPVMLLPASKTTPRLLLLRLALVCFRCLALASAAVPLAALARREPVQPQQRQRDVHLREPRAVGGHQPLQILQALAPLDGTGNVARVGERRRVELRLGHPQRQEGRRGARNARGWRGTEGVFVLVLVLVLLLVLLLALLLVLLLALLLVLLLVLLLGTGGPRPA
jgi:hypothetical protein